MRAIITERVFEIVDGKHVCILEFSAGGVDSNVRGEASGGFVDAERRALSLLSDWLSEQN